MKKKFISTNMKIFMLVLLLLSITFYASGCVVLVKSGYKLSDYANELNINPDAFKFNLNINGLNFDFNTEETIYFNDLEGLIEKLINQLPPRRKEIFVLSRQQGLTYVEIAKKLDITENTVDTQLRKALDFIRPELIKLFL